MSTQVIADRFVETSGGRVVDLATGEDVVLNISSAGGPTDQLRWAARCDWFQRLFHPSLPRLVDYGVLGEFRRFEAWQCAGPPCAASSSDACRAARWAAAFLRACGLTAWSGAAGVCVERDGGRTVLVPDAGAGYPDGGGVPSDNPVPAEQSGLVSVERGGLAALAELFEAPLASSRQAQVICIWGPEGCGKTSAVYELARVARLNGFVPVSARLLGSPVGDLLHGRAVCVVDDGQSDWRRGLIDVSIRSPHPHVVVCTSREDPRGIAGIRLARLSPAALVAAVRPTELAADVRIRRAAERADGVPGRFARLIHGARYGVARRRTLAAVTAAERAPVYGAAEVTLSEPLPVVSAAWPNPDEICALRRRMASAREQLAAGRHAPGDRDLRQAVGGLARRGDWTGAAEGSLVLAASLLKRGRARDAKVLLDGAREYCQRSTSDDPAVAAATLVGVAWTDLARLGEAESVLSGAMASELGHGGPCAAGLLLAMARCRFWQGRFVDADVALSTLRAAPADASTTVRLHALRARIAVGRLDFTEAMSAAAEAVHRAVALADPMLVGEAHCAAAFTHLAVGDLASLQDDVEACVAAARAARDPLRALRAYLMLVEQLRRAGRQASAIEVMNKVRRLARARLPPILRRRYDLMSDLLTTESAEDLAARHAAAAGLPALTLYGPRCDAGSSLSGVVEDALAMLRACQRAEEEETTLAVVCEQAQRRLEAAAVAFFGIEGGLSIRIAGSSRVGASVADRASAAGVPIAPHRLEDRVEAAVPIRYGGAIVGALGARWLLNRSPDGSRVISTLTMAATAAAPLVQSMLAERSRAATPATLGLLGVSAAMAEVRRAAERAANAPFAVLVEGESGSGKELVARAVHRGGARRDRPFRTLNCAALPDELVESELFGHARGAFTGAVAERVGVFEEAHSGTLLLDEVGELSLRAQAKLLRVLQEGELRRIGENTSRRIDVRIVSATNRDLRQDAAAGRFRLDLLYRLDVVRIVVPSLRERREDIPLLVGHFWGEAVARVGSRAALSPAAVVALARYDWPGNVRELQNVLSALAVRVGRRGVVAPDALPPQFAVPLAASDCRLSSARRAFDERYVRAALVRTGGSRARTAAELGISRQGLTKLMTRLGIADRAL